MRVRPALVIGGLAWFAGSASARLVAAQELEPGAYEVAPTGVQVATVAYSYNDGDVGFDPAAPIEDSRARIHNLVLSYGRSLNLFGRSGQIGVGAPFVVGSLQGRFRGDLLSGHRAGFADPRVRVAVNLYGAPAMEGRAFREHRGNTLMGLSLSLVLPFGEYESTRVINPGTNRWAFKPEAGLSHTVGRWKIEWYGGVWLFTTNTAFYGGRRREQQPIGETQLHVEYQLRRRIATTFNVNYYTGGRTTVDGQRNFDLQQNSRLGGTLTLPAGQRRGVRVAVSWGAYTTVGAAFTSVSTAYLYSWGGAP